MDPDSTAGYGIFSTIIESKVKTNTNFTERNQCRDNFRLSVHRRVTVRGILESIRIEKTDLRIELGQ
jgi:hypothetical protein